MITLTDGQAIAKEELLHTITNSMADKFHTLRGGAGFGKSTLIVDVIKDIPISKSIGFAAPTHKACKVLRKMLKGVGLEHRVPVNTIHSTLGLKLVQHGENEVIKKDGFSKEDIYDVLFIDESSMLGDEILGYVLKSQSGVIIFVGDECQISPIHTDAHGYPTGSEKESEVFSQVDKQSKLTEVVRCAADSPIIKLSTQMRASQKNGTPLPYIETKLGEYGNGILVFDSDEFRKGLVDKFTSEEFDKDIDHCRCVAYTNKCVDKINNFVRTSIHGNNVAEYIVGEKIIAQRQMAFQYKNAEEFTILEAELGANTENSPDPIPCWHLSIYSLDDGRTYDVDVVAQEGLQYFQHLLNTYAARARAGNAKINWRSFWSLRDAFGEFKHVYAMTSHKSQGSTFDNTYIYTPDFLEYGTGLTMKRLLYTSTTRSSLNTVFAK